MNRLVAGRNPVTKAIVAAAEEQGWAVDLRGGHIRLTPPAGKGLSIAFSPSDRRTALNDRSRARRAGLKV